MRTPHYFVAWIKSTTLGGGGLCACLYVSLFCCLPVGLCPDTQLMAICFLRLLFLYFVLNLFSVATLTCFSFSAKKDMTWNMCALHAASEPTAAPRPKNRFWQAVGDDLFYCMTGVTEATMFLTVRSLQRSLSIHPLPASHHFPSPPNRAHTHTYNHDTTPRACILRRYATPADFLLLSLVLRPSVHAAKYFVDPFF